MKNNKSQILYISYDGMTDPLGQSQVIPYLQKLSKEGYVFTLLSCEKKDRYNKYKDIVSKILKESNIEWFPVPYHKNPPVLSTIYDFVRLRYKAVDLHKKKQFSLVHCRSYISSLIGLHLKRKFKIPFIFDMRGFWADERVDGKLWDLNKPLYNYIYKFFKKKEREFIADSASVISLTKAGKREIENWSIYQKYKTPLRVIPCSTDFSLFSPIDEDKKRKIKDAVGVDQRAFVLSYLGSIGTWYMLEEMLDFFIELSKKYSTSVFLFITPDDPELIKKCADRKGVPQEKIYVVFALRSEVADYTSISDVSIFFIKPCFSKLGSSPTKLGELLAMGIPVICNEGVGDVKEIIKFTNGGFAIGDFSQKAYRGVVDAIGILKEINKNEIRDKAMEYYSLEKAAKEYASIYQSIIKK